MRVAYAEMDVQQIVGQMDMVVGQLRIAWAGLNAQRPWMFTPGTAAAAQARFDSLRGLIDDLDVGGVARQHVFFPLEGQTENDAWTTWKDTAEYIRNGLNDLGAFIGRWGLAATIGRIGEDVKDQFKSTGLMLAAVAVGVGLLALTSRARGFSGYRRRRSRR